MSEKCPASGLATAQQMIITEQTADASVAVSANRCLRYAGPQSPVNDSIAPTKPPCARKISQVLRYVKIFGKSRTRPPIVWWLRCSSTGAKLVNPLSDGSLDTIAAAAAPMAITHAADPSATARQPKC